MAMPTKPGNNERGWNDPPVFLHTESPKGATAIPPRRTPLTKRVFHSEAMGEESTSPPTTLSSSPPFTGSTPPTSGFMLPPASSDLYSHDSTNQRKETVTTSMDAQKPPKSNVVLFPPTATTAVSSFPAPIIIPNMGQTGTSPPVEILTPPGSPTILLPVGSPSSSNSLREPSLCQQEVEIPHFNDDQQLFHYVVSRLQKVMKHCQPMMGDRVTEDISKKLKIFESMWEEGKISYQVKASMAKLAIALHERKCDLAHEIHLNLMMDYVSEVGQWMVGIKRLIQEARNLGTPVSPAETDASALSQEVSSNSDKVLSQDGSCGDGDTVSSLSQQLEASSLLSNTDNVHATEDSFASHDAQSQESPQSNTDKKENSAPDATASNTDSSNPSEKSDNAPPPDS